MLTGAALLPGQDLKTVQEALLARSPGLQEATVTDKSVTPSSCLLSPVGVNELGPRDPGGMASPP